MGEVITNTGSKVSMEEVEGTVNLQDLYQDVTCTDYTEAYRIRCMEACAKLGRQAWGVLPTLHELSKAQSVKLADAATAALRKVDPGMPSLKKDMVTETHVTRRGLGTSTSTGYEKGKTFAYTAPNGTVTYKKPERRKVKVDDITTPELHEGTRVYGTCCFCEKTAIFPKNLMKCNEVVAGPDRSGKRRLFCNFCLRNEFYKLKHSKNILILSYRGLIGYYYYCFHAIPKTTSMYLSDLQAYIELHVKMGVQNPLFRYDPESLCWFIDFTKVGNRPRQMPLNYVLETAMDILAAFNLYDHVKDCSPATLFNKYKDAIVDFHHHRRRPAGQRLLVPTLFGCGIPMETSLNKAIPIQALKNFVPNHMIENFKNTTSRTGWRC